MASGNCTGANKLSTETSLYLRASAGDAVDWYAWGDEAFDAAKASDRPVLLSIGFSACHECHVMQRESFQDEQTAAYLNEHFVCVKVDHQERPEVGAIYAKAVLEMAGESGWPLTVFLTPDRLPIDGGTYLPPEDRAGKPAFGTVVRRVVDAWSSRRDAIFEQGRLFVEGLTAGEHPDPFARPLSDDTLFRAAARMALAYDDEHGGFGTGPQYPRPQALELLIRTGARGLLRAKTMTERTLKAMALGGIYDQVGGGFHRHTTDRAWQVPRFEKMLSDNALLARVYTHAWQAWHDPLYRRVAEETLDYIVRDLGTERGGLATSESSESEGVEGRFYTWTHDEVTEVAPDALFFFGVKRDPPAFGANVLVAMTEELPEEALRRLREARGRRVRPHRDDLVLASWNGLAIGALAEGGASFARPDLVEAARRAAGFVTGHLLVEGDLFHADGIPGLLEDYAYVAEGLVTLWEVTFERRWLDLAAALADRMTGLFWDEESGAFYATPRGRSDLPARVKPILEADTPSGNAVAAHVLQRLAALLGRDDHRERADRILGVAGPYIEANPESTAGFFAAVDLYTLGPKEVVIVGDPAVEGTGSLAAEAWARLVPNRVLAGGPPGSEAPLLEGREPVEGRPTAFVRDGDTSMPATTDPAELARQLRPWKAPTDKQVTAMVGRMSGAVQYRHLFDQLQNPRWMAPLRDRGFFASPPETVLDYARGTIGSPPWPESGYLARAAQSDPVTAHAIGLAIPDNDNAQVHEDIADLALALPAQLAADFVPRLAAWAGMPYHLLLADKLGRLLTHLAAGGAVDAAMELGRSVLELIPDPMQRIPGEDRFRPSPEPGTKFEEFEYTLLVTERIPELVEAAGPPALALLCEALESAIALSARPGEDIPPADHSYIWRPAIEEEPPAEQAPRDVLLTALRDAAVGLAQRGPDELRQVVDMLQARSRHVFGRVALHVMAEIEATPMALIRPVLLDRSLLENPHFHHEHLLLAADRFTELTDDERGRILGWIAEGPGGLDTRTLSRWTQDRLALLLDVVPEPWQRRYHELTDELGPPEHPEFAAPPGAGRRRNSPKSADDLRRMGLPKMLEYLRTWTPPGGWARPSRDGLAHEVMLTVAADPEPHARAADQFDSLDLAYVEAFLFGLREAVKRELSFPWKPVVELCGRILSRAATVDGDTEALAGCRRETAHLLSAGFATGPAEMPFDLRTQIWSVLKALTDDPDPDLEQENKLLKAGVELVTISTNTTRGKALHATVRYGLWVRRHIEKGAGSVQRVMAGFDEMPEVREVLDAHLDHRRDPCTGMRVVYGWWLPWLVMLDPEWTRRRLPEILPRDKALDEHRHAAWGAYVTFNTPYENVWNLLKNEYKRAVERLDPKGSPVLHLPGPRERVAEHLMSVFWRGKIKIEESDSAISRFFSRAPDALAAHAITFAGRSLPGWKGPVPGEVKLRLMKLFERRVAAARRDPAAHQLEMAAFGWWFATGLFEQKWAIQQLDVVTDLTGGRLDSTHMAVAKLAEKAGSAPAKAVEILARIVEGDRGHTIVGWRDQGRAVLSAVMESPDDKAREAAMDLLDAFTVEDLPQDTTWEAVVGKPSSKRGASDDMRPIGPG
jgi:hypothetical protein